MTGSRASRSNFGLRRSDFLWGSLASGTSKKTELKLTNVARASLEELRLDYEDFLRQREWPLWPPDHPALKRFKARRCTTLDDVRAWVEDERTRGRMVKTDTVGQGRTGTSSSQSAATGQASVSVGVSPCPSSTGVTPSSVLVANAALSLLNLACYFLGRQLAAQASAFEKEGGFTERLYRIRSKRRGER